MHVKTSTKKLNTEKYICTCFYLVKTFAIIGIKMIQATFVYAVFKITQKKTYKIHSTTQMSTNRGLNSYFIKYLKC